MELIASALRLLRSAEPWRCRADLQGHQRFPAWHLMFYPICSCQACPHNSHLLPLPPPLCSCTTRLFRAHRTCHVILGLWASCHFLCLEWHSPPHVPGKLLPFLQAQLLFHSGKPFLTFWGLSSSLPPLISLYTEAATLCSGERATCYWTQTLPLTSLSVLVSYLTSISLNLLICKMGIIVVPVSQLQWEIKYQAQRRHTTIFIISNTSVPFHMSAVWLWTTGWYIKFLPPLLDY